MGAYSPPARFPDDLYDRVRERILAPLLRGLLADGEEYAGVIYCGLMWTARGPQVVEFNARFGDPETQVLLPRIGGDFALLLESVARGAMDLSVVSESAQHCVGVVLATSDYPRTNTPLAGLNPDVSLGERRRAFWGSSQLIDGSVSTGGGRVLTVTALGEDLAEARAGAYDAVAQLAHRLGTNALTYRTDIAASSP
jgi:phosphoribosylamine--glycine ligase